MLIHSVTHPYMLTENQAYPEMTLKPIPGGYIEGYDTPDGFKTQRLFSTDPSAYLKTSPTPDARRKTGSARINGSA